MTHWQCTYNGLTFGDGTDIDVAQIEGLTDLPALRTGDRNRPQSDGMFAGSDYLAGRSVVLDLEVGDGDITAREATLAAMREAFIRPALAPSQLADTALTEMPFTFHLPGQEARQINCRVRRRSETIDQEWSIGQARMAIEMFATDPRIYTVAENTLSTSLATTTGGLAFPHGHPHGFGSVVSGTIAITNLGNFRTPPTLTVTATAAMSNPKIEHVDSGEYIEASISLALGDVLVFDVANRQVTLNGSGSRTNTITRPGSSWWELYPGAQNVRFSAASGAGDLAVAWRDAWI